MPTSNPGSVPKPTLKLRKSSTVVFSPSGRYLAQITSKVIIWDLVTRKVATQVKLLRNECYVCFSPNERVLAAKNTNGEFVFYDLVANEAISSTGRFAWAQEGNCPVFSPDGKHVIDADWNGGIRRLEVATARAAEEHYFGFGYMSGGCYSDSVTGKTFVIFNAKSGTRGGGKVLVYEPDQPLCAPSELHPGSLSLSAQGGWKRIEDATQHPSGKGLALSVRAGNSMAHSTIELINLEGESMVSIPMASPMHFVQGLAWSRSGRLCATVHEIAGRTGMGFNEWQALQAANIFEHVHFYADSSGASLGVWPWRKAWRVAFSPGDDGLAVGSSGADAALYSPLPIDSPQSPLL